jgi:hypothetical protein
MKKSTIERYLDQNNPQRWDLMNYLIEKYKIINYLEIGVNDALCIRKIKAPHKDGVDPYPGSEVGGGYYPEINYPISSDDFFKLINGHDIKYDMIFIDGLHHSFQVDKDIQNALNHIVDNGFIILHDCNPPEYEMQLVPRVTGLWNGDVWKSVVKLRCTDPNLEMCVVDIDWGVGVVKKGIQKLYTDVSLDKCLTYKYFDINRDKLINLISIEDFYKKY